MKKAKKNPVKPKLEFDDDTVFILRSARELQAVTGGLADSPPPPNVDMVFNRPSTL